MSTWRVDSARDADAVTGLENNADDGSADGVALLVAPRSYTWIVAGGLGIEGFARLAAAAGVDVGGARFTS